MTESQIVAVLKEVEAGVPVAEVVRKAGVSKATFFTWRSKYGGATVRELALLVDAHGLTVTRACQAVRVSRTAYYEPPLPRGQRRLDGA